VSELNFKTITDGLGAVLYQYPFNVPAYYALILRSLTVLEGLALFTDPNFKVRLREGAFLVQPSCVHHAGAQVSMRRR
jgi:predicted unusual protein kinase regulating ubiquinone biosynthesis (AarF/ABC1/UbiB family)